MALRWKFTPQVAPHHWIPSILLDTVHTDVDGYYFYSYKHTGKEAIFTVKLLVYNLTHPVTLKANKFGEANFTIP